MILTDCPELRSVPWRCVVIDEAHRLKNRNCKLLEGLKMMDMVSYRPYKMLFVAIKYYSYHALQVLS